MSKRILLFSLVYYPRFVAGAEVALKEITDRISPSAFEFDMITLRLDSSLSLVEKIGNITVYRIGFSKKNPTAQELGEFPLYLVKVLYPIWAFFKALSLHKKNSYDAMWAMMSYMGFPALFLKTFYPRIKFLLTLQEGDTLEHVAKRFRIRAVSYFYKKIFKKADHIQAISNFLADFARDMGGKSVSVIPNGVDVEKFKNQNSEVKSEEIRKRLEIRQSDIVLITTSRLVEKNAVGDIISALLYLPEDVKLMIAGTGPLEKKLKLEVGNEKLHNRVVFLGYISHDELPDYLHASDIFVRPSLSEGMGNSFIEAMAAGLPVIATKVGGIPDFLKDKETGLFCEIKNPKSIAEKVDLLLKDGELKQTIIKNSIKMVSEKYDWNLIASKMKEIF